MYIATTTALLELVIQLVMVGQSMVLNSFSCNREITVSTSYN